jgi:hypothetical protein
MFGARAGAIVIGALASLAAPAPGAYAEGVRNVLELFTSQGCSSCPPADRILSQLSRDPSVLALSFPVDYWDYIGWKDTLAAPNYTARQKAYASASGKGQVYTPQVIVNGLADAVGSDLEAIEQAERTTAKRSGVLSVPLSVVEEGGKINVSVGTSGLRQFAHRHDTAGRERRFDIDLRQCRASDYQNRRLERRAGQSGGRSFAGASERRRFLCRDRPGRRARGALGNPGRGARTWADAV